MATNNSVDGARSQDYTTSGKAYVTDDKISDIATYTATHIGAVTATTASDVFVISGGAGKVVRVIGLLFGATQNTAAVVNVSLIKRSTANTGGTPVTINPISMDSTDIPAVAAVRAYTANPTVGTAVGTLLGFQKLIGATNTLTGETKTKEIFFKQLGMKEPVLRGVNESLAFNLNNTTVTGINAAFTVIWVEE